VGLSFAFTPGEAYYIPCPADQQATKKYLNICHHYLMMRKKSGSDKMLNTIACIEMVWNRNKR